MFSYNCSEPNIPVMFDNPCTWDRSRPQYFNISGQIEIQLCCYDKDFCNLPKINQEILVQLKKSYLVKYSG